MNAATGPRPRRRALLAALPGLLGAAGGCSVLPDRPFQETQRFALAPERPGPRVPAPPRAPVLLLRLLRAAPGLDQRGLRVLGAAGRVEVTFWAEWAAPPAEAVEEAMRRWLAASGLFSAVVAPGSRLPADLVLEGELIRLQAEPPDGVARAALSVLLLSESEADAAGRARIRGQFLPEGMAPLPGGRRATPGALPPAEAAAAMQAALGEALAGLEAGLRRSLGPAAATARAVRR